MNIYLIIYTAYVSNPTSLSLREQVSRKFCSWTIFQRLWTIYEIESKSTL